MKIAELAWKRKIFIICDEVYKDFIYDSEIGLFSLAQISELRKIVIRVFSLSKSVCHDGLANWFYPQRRRKHFGNRKSSRFFGNLRAGHFPIRGHMRFGFRRQRNRGIYQKISKRRDLICRHLDDLTDFFSYQKPNSSYFVFPKISKTKNSWKFGLDLLNKAHVAVVPGVAFGPSGEGHIRMSFGGAKKTLMKQ